MTKINTHIAGTMSPAVTLGIGDEIFAVEATNVREILDMVPVTEVPNAPPFIGGLINVRGRVVPLADLHVKFGMERRAADADTRIVVLELNLADEPAIVGVLADRVHDVIDIDMSCLAPAPKVGMRWRREYVRGIAKRDGNFIIVPDMGRIFENEGSRNQVPEAEGK